MVDNATNNDYTLGEAIEKNASKIKSSALLQAIGAVENGKSGIYYQETVTAAPDFDEEAVAMDEEDDELGTTPLGLRASFRKIIRAVISNPQHRQQSYKILSPPNPFIVTNRDLRTKLKKKLAALPEEANPELVQGFNNAHRKLSDYYYKYDQSPVDIWAIHYAGGVDITEYLEEQQTALRKYFDDNYPAASSTSRRTTTASAPNTGAKKAAPQLHNINQGSDEDEDSDEPLRYF
ncbi:hypothetical protein C8F04DRAFT_1199885 [Mycena alexandri]|uniref:Uncharacterized protein n=1 Tax=Mycena alexandri TaxID=1745969 RepID=A0AAD6S2Q5_9AGAR|nr:hypothetical protein C8F04DRAFT_1199885 [Mycena alexandri]